VGSRRDSSTTLNTGGIIARFKQIKRTTATRKEEPSTQKEREREREKKEFALLSTRVIKC